MVGRNPTCTSRSLDIREVSYLRPTFSLPNLAQSLTLTLPPQSFVIMANTRSTRSTRNRPQTFPTEENTPTELAAPKRNQRKRRASKIKATDSLVAENGADGATTGLDSAGDKMKLGEIKVLSSKVGIGLIVVNNRHRASR